MAERKIILTDEGFMRRALRLARKGEGRVSPNPLVGAVIVRDGRIIAEGYHRRYGENHAEIDAIANATEPVAGATFYITLEPCSHYGKTPPCVDALIASRPGRVVVGTIDPNPLVSGRGIAALQQSRDRNEDGGPRRGVPAAKRGLLQIHPDRRPLRHPEVRPDPRRPDRHRLGPFTLDQLPRVAPFRPPVAARPRRDPRRGRDRPDGRPGAHLPPRPGPESPPDRRRFPSADLTGCTVFDVRRAPTIVAATRKAPEERRRLFEQKGIEVLELGEDEGGARRSAGASERSWVKGRSPPSSSRAVQASIHRF